MALHTAPQTYTWRDAKGNIARTKIHVTWDDAHGADLGTLINTLQPLFQAISNANLEHSMGAAWNGANGFGYGSQATFGSAEDKAALSFNTLGGTHTLQIPAPKAAIFLTDAETVNAAQSDIVALVAEIVDGETTAFVTDAAGNQVTGMIGGFRVRRKNQRKVNIFTKAPNESIPAE
jgi:hypothetical protein